MKVIVFQNFISEKTCLFSQRQCSLEASSLGPGGAKKGKIERELAPTSQGLVYLQRQF